MDEKINYRQQWFDGEIEAGTLLDTIDHLSSKVEELGREVLKTYAVAPVAQEPVAWALIDRDGLVRLLHKTEEASRSAAARWAKSYSGCSHVPLYTAPPTLPWWSQLE